ncbi:MAG: hypothetical protein ACFFF9_05885 [Candidatus Thorarchaeota archaeon]
MIEISVDLAIIIGIVLPIVLPSLLYIGVRRVNTEGNLYKYLVRPPQFQSENSNSLENSDMWTQIKIKLGFIYLGMALFLVSFVLSEFYEVIFDITLPVNQGSTGEMRTISSLAFLSLFNAGWVGSLPWYGWLPAPAGFGNYHDPWGWIFTTAAYTDNPNFLGTIVSVLFITSVMVGTVFLLPLVSRRIRESFVPSLIVFTTGMAVFTKTIVGGLGHAIALALGAQIPFGIRIVTGNLVPDLNEVVVVGFLFFIGLYFLFLIIGQRLWKIHYDDRRSRLGFLLYITIIYWIGLVLTIMVV